MEKPVVVQSQLFQVVLQTEERILGYLFQMVVPQVEMRHLQ